MNKTDLLHYLHALQVDLNQHVQNHEVTLTHGIQTDSQRETLTKPTDEEEMTDRTEIKVKETEIMSHIQHKMRIWEKGESVISKGVFGIKEVLVNGQIDQYKFEQMNI